jgi:hypothetical protein
LGSTARSMHKSSVRGIGARLHTDRINGALSHSPRCWNRARQRA